MSAAQPAFEQDDRARFERDGFLAVAGLVPADEIAAIRSIYDDLFARRAGWERGDFFDMLDPEERQVGPRLLQLAWPSREAPFLAATEMRRRAFSLATELLGPRAELVWEFAILKPPRHGAATPWHQDEACFTTGTPYRTAISVWIPLQDVDEATGCMRYVPGSHHGELAAHAPFGGDMRAHAVAAVAPDTRGAVTVPLAAGDAVLHHSRTLHGAGPNLTDRPRRAITLEFAVPDRAQMIRRDYAWNRRTTARDARANRATPIRQRLRRGLRLALIRLGW